MRTPTTTSRLQNSNNNNNSDSNVFLKKRDSFILVICCIAVFLSFQTQRFFLEETWVQPLDTSNFENMHYPSDKEKLPNPLITDLEGDGINEIVFVTTDYRVCVADTTNTEKKKHIFDFPLKADASLLSTTRVTAGRRPIALAAGYFTPLENLHVHTENNAKEISSASSNTTNTREQFIVVVTDGWTVLCFNKNLKLIWESHMREHFPQNSYTSEIAVMLIPKPIRINDKGAVIIGARLRTEKVESIQHEHGETISHVHKDEKAEPPLLDENEEHFSYYAFDGRTGALRWKHEQGDFFDASISERHEDEGEEIFGYMPEHSYKLHVWSAMKHQGEVDWRLFKHDIFHQMPHYWSSKYDTHFDLYHFTKRRITGGGSNMDEKSAWSAEDLGVPLSHIPGLPFGGEAPHTASDHIVKPNVVVAHTKSGIEVIHLYTGRTLCSLALPPQSLYADLNGDGMLDSVRVTSLESQDDSEEQGGPDATDVPCDILAKSGIPPIEPMFNGSICNPVGGFFANLFTDSSVEKKQRAHQAPTNPVVIESSRSSTMMNVHSEHEFDTVFLVSSGRMTSFRPNGKVNWQLDTPASWIKKEITLSQRRRRIEAAKKKGPEVPILASLSTFSLEAYGDSKYLLAVGHAAAVVSPTGELLASLSLVDTAMSTPVIGDFNNDGINDFILVTSRGYRGYTLHSSIGYGFLPFVIVLIVVSLVLVIAVNNYSQPAAARKRAID